ncbi:MAG: hypothetical protein ACP5F1_01620 [Thermoplasmata archaeon]|nr:hypothetical protein [Thermoplasmata archaeon]
MIMITFILTISVLFYAINILNLSPRINESNYLSAMLDENGSNVSVFITEGSISVPFKVELFSNMNSVVVSGTVYKLKNFTYINGTYNNENVALKIVNVDHNQKLGSGDYINFINIYANEITNFKLIIVYENFIVLNYAL